MPRYIDAFTVSAPGRICLFGEHYCGLGLGAMAMAVDLRVTIAADSTDGKQILVRLPDAKTPIEVVAGADVKGLPRHLAAALDLVQRDTGPLERGYSFRITSHVPAGAGFGWAAALAVAWTTALLRTHDRLRTMSGNDIGQLACDALAHAAECAGKIDAYVCGLGGKMRAEPGESRRMSPLVGAQLDGFVAGHGKPEHDEPANLRRVAEQTAAAAQALQAQAPELDIRSAPIDEALVQLHRVSDEHAGLLYAMLNSRDLCEQAVEMLSADVFDRDRLGEMIDEEHAMLRDYLMLSNDDVERAIAAAKKAGALGAKAIGAGHAMLAYAPDKQKEVADAIRAEGWEAHVVAQADGARLDAGALSPPWA